MDLAQATGVPETIDLAGEPYPVRLLTFREWGAIGAWLKRENPSPITRAALAIHEARAMGEPLSAEVEDKMLDHAQMAALAWPPKLGTKEWFDAVDKAEGGYAYLLFEVLSKADPNFTREKAEVVAQRLSQEDWGDLIRVSLFGGHPRPKVGQNGDHNPP